jgi:predicted Zn finger-like uncharacterized protein
MKFVCENCATQYLISDEKVGSKGVKVRCKRCGNVIIVKPAETRESRREPQTDVVPFSGGSAPGDAQSQEPAPNRDELGQAFDQLLKTGMGNDVQGDEPEDAEEGQATMIFNVDELERLQGLKGEAADQKKIDQAFSGMESTELPGGVRSQQQAQPEWYVAIRDEQVGPLTLDDVTKRWQNGEVTESTLSWCAGMEDWKPIKDVPRLRHLLDSTKAFYESEEAKSRTSQEPQEQWAQSGGSILSSLVEEEIAAVKSSSPPAAAVPKKVEKPAPSSLSTDEDVPPWERESTGSGAKEEPKPSEGVFDSALDKSNPSIGSSYFDDSYNRPSPFVVQPAYLGAKSKGSLWVKVGIGGGVLALLVLSSVVTMFLMKGEVVPAHQQASNKVEPSQPPKPENTLDGGAGASAAPGETAKTQEAASQGASTDPSGVKANPAESGKNTNDGKEIIVARPTGSKTGEDKKPAGTDKPKTTAGVVPQKPAGAKPEKPQVPAKVNPKGQDAVAPSSDGEVLDTLSKAIIGETMRKYLGAMKGCVEQQQQRDPSVTGMLKVSYVIENSGKVETINILSSEHQGTYVANCISEIFKGMRFPRFKGSPITVPVPLRLGD